MKQLVVAPKLESFKNGEFSKYTRTVLELSKEQDLRALELISYANELKVNYANFRAVYKKNRGSLLTPQMVMHDQHRDNGLKLIQRGTKLIADLAAEEQDRNLAMLLYKTITKHGKEIYNMAYNQQGGVMDEIIEEIEGSPELNTALDILQQRKYFNEMKAAHAAFDNIFKSRVKEQQLEQTDLNIVTLRKLTSRALRELFDWIFIRAKTNGISQFETYIGNLNVLTEQYNLSVERRLSGKSNTHQELNDDYDQQQGNV
ncbi:DUF6261 family protein [Aquimarina longa]|uniref:DUF6261 family protein n=1 Tax=Aquimarina longa TaxID=1080221 RepID=UPI0007845562|nr:DUF6261 family protein [Aquimarina longa]